MTNADKSVLVGRLLLISALVALALGIVFLSGALPLANGAAPVVGGVLVFVALTDAGLGMWFLKRGQR